MVVVRGVGGERSCCFPREVVVVNGGLALVDGFIALLALSQYEVTAVGNIEYLKDLEQLSNYFKALYCMQKLPNITDPVLLTFFHFELLKIHSRDSRSGWNRQEVFHLLIGASNFSYSIYFILIIVAACERWRSWSYSFGFFLTALPQIISFAAFFLLLSFWVDLCHQPDDEDYEEEFSFHEALLEVASDDSSRHADGHRLCLPFRSIHVGSRQRIVILVTAILIVVMISFAVVIWIGMGNNSSWLARVYVIFLATLVLLLGGALAYYGFLLYLKMKRIRSDRAAAEMHKVAGMAIVSVLCFSARALVAFFSQVSVLYYCQELDTNGLYTSLLLILYYFIGSSVPSAFVLWIMRDLPPAVPAKVHEESSTITFRGNTSTAIQNPQRWTNVTSLENQGT